MLRHPAAAAFATYYLISLLVGEVYPFSRYEMYSGAGSFRGAVIVCRSGGSEVSLGNYDRFAGFDPGALAYPPGEHFGSEYKLDEVRHTLETHRVRGAEPPNSVHLEIGIRIVEATDEGLRVVAAFVPMAEGRAWSSD